MTDLTPLELARDAVSNAAAEWVTAAQEGGEESAVTKFDAALAAFEQEIRRPTPATAGTPETTDDDFYVELRLRNIEADDATRAMVPEHRFDMQWLVKELRSTRKRLKSVAPTVLAADPDAIQTERATPEAVKPAAFRVVDVANYVWRFEEFEQDANAEAAKMNEASQAKSFRVEPLYAAPIAPRTVGGAPLRDETPARETCPHCEGSVLAETGALTMEGYAITVDCACGDGSLAGYASRLERQLAALRAAASPSDETPEAPEVKP